MGRAGVSRHDHARARRRQDRGARPSLSLYADRQSALDDPGVVVRHPRGRRAARRSKRPAPPAPNWWCCSPTTASTSTASLPRGCRGIDVVLTGPHPRRAAGRRQGRPDVAGRLRQPRQVRVAARSRRARRRGEGLSLQADPDLCRRHRAGPGHGGEDRGRPGAASRPSGRGGRPRRAAALPARQFQRHARRRDLRRAAQPSATPRSRCRPACAGARRCCPARRSRARTSTTPPPSRIRPLIAPR